MMILFVLLLSVQISSSRNDNFSGGSASKEFPRDVESYRSLPIGRSERSLGKVKMSDSYATIALHGANMLTGSRQQESKWLLLTAGDISRTINSLGEKDSSTAQNAEANSHGLFSTVSSGHTTSADDKGYTSIGHQEDEESLEVESDGFEQVQKSAIIINSSTPSAPAPPSPPRSPIGIKFWPKCCSMGEILYVPSPPSRSVCELFEGPRLASPSLLQGLGLEWGRNSLSGGLPPSCRSGEQVQIFWSLRRYMSFTKYDPGDFCPGYIVSLHTFSVQGENNRLRGFHRPRRRPARAACQDLGTLLVSYILLP